MSDIPFHVTCRRVGTREDADVPPAGAYTGALPLLRAPEPRISGSRRRKLWEMPHKFHCPVIGVCFDCGELRAQMHKVMHLPREATDFLLHTTAVGACEERSRLSELLHKALEKRFQLAVRDFAAAKTAAELGAAWRAACHEAHRIPAALWAVWTHPACDGALEQEVYGDIHMIQHQVGAGTRADLLALKTLKAENAALKRESEKLKAENEALRREKAGAAVEVRRQADAWRSDAMAAVARESALLEQLTAVHDSVPELADRRQLQERCNGLVMKNGQLRQRLAEQDKELSRLRDFAVYAEETLASLAREDDARPELPAGDLRGKRVLCVGGRSGSVHCYRRIVEQSGGRFLHHDGGLEESLHRIDGALAAADMVICQAGCISHNAYWRVKDLCKRNGKPCIFVKGGGVSSFGRIVGDAAGMTGDGAPGA